MQNDHLREDCPEGSWAAIGSNLKLESESSDSKWLNMTFNGKNYSTAVTWIDSKDKSLTKTAILVGKTFDSDLKPNLTTMKPLTGCNTEEESNTWSCQGYGAAICILQPSVRIYNATITAGHLEEVLISQSDSTHWGLSNSSTRALVLSLVDIQCLSSNQRKRLEQRGYHLSSSSRWLPYNLLTPTATSAPEFETDPLAFYLLENKCLYKMDILVGEGFARNALRNNDIDGMVQAGTFVLTANGSILASSFDGLSMLRQLYNRGDIEFEQVQSTFEKFSDILTAWMRTHGNATISEPAMGEVWHYGTCLRVYWPWLSFPAALTLLALLFFVLVVLHTKRRQTLSRDSPALGE
jgi:hypothetical protein